MPSSLTNCDLMISPQNRDPPTWTRYKVHEHIAWKLKCTGPFIFNHTAVIDICKFEYENNCKYNEPNKSVSNTYDYIQHPKTNTKPQNHPVEKKNHVPIPTSFLYSNIFH